MDAVRATMAVFTVQEREMQAESNKARTYKTIKASEFKAKCLELMDEVAESGEEIVITKRGRPVSRLVPYREKQGKKVQDSGNAEKPKSLFGLYRGKIGILGDIESPIDVEWNAETGKGWDDLP